MNYEKQILDILFQAGNRGLTVKKIAYHVHHQVNSLFEQVSYDDVYNDVRNYIYANSSSSNATLTHGDSRGCYVVNKNSDKFRQLVIQFDNPWEE